MGSGTGYKIVQFCNIILQFVWFGIATLLPSHAKCIYLFLQVMAVTSEELQHLESRSLSSLLSLGGIIRGVLDAGFWEVGQKTAHRCYSWKNRGNSIKYHPTCLIPSEPPVPHCTLPRPKTKA